MRSTLDSMYCLFLLLNFERVVAKNITWIPIAHDAFFFVLIPFISMTLNLFNIILEEISL